MAFSWNTIGMDTPLVRGRPKQFEEVSTTFQQIAGRTDSLSDELWDLRRGRSDEFAGEAADSFGMNIGEILVPLSDVPKVSSRISSTFDRHGCQLEELRTKASEALARAHTRWNRKQSAESEIRSHESSISSLNRQISQLRCCCAGPCVCNVDTYRSNLTSRRRSFEYDLSCARSDLRTAEDLLDDSRNDWSNIRQYEDDLNEATAHQLKYLPLWNLKNKGRIERAKEYMGEKYDDLKNEISKIWDTVVNELLLVLHDTLSTLLDWLDIAGLVLEWIPVVNVAFKFVEITVALTKAVTGLGLVLLTGQMSFSEFLIDTAIDAAGVALPGGRLAGKAIKKVFKSGCLERVMKFATKKVDAVEGYTKQKTASVAKAVYRLPVIKQLNDMVYRGQSKLYRKKWFPSFHKKSYKIRPLGIRFDDLDKQSWITRTARRDGFVKVGVLSPVGKTYEQFATDRIFEDGLDKATRAIERIVRQITDGESPDTPHRVLVPCTF